MTPKSFRQTAGMFIGAFLFCASVPVSATVTVEIRVEGLPSGLQVSERGEFLTCPPRTPQPVPTSAGSVVLQEHTEFTVGQAPSLGTISPAAGFLLVPHAVYSGSLTADLPTNPDLPPPDTRCTQQVIANSMKLFLGILGEDANGHQKLRETGVGSVQFESNVDTKQTFLKARAATDSITEGTASTTPPTTLQKGGSHRLVVSYFDTFGGSSVKAPSLAFTQQGTVTLLGTHFSRPVSQTRARMTLTDDSKVCLFVVGNETKCAPLTQGSALVNGDVTVNVGQIQSAIVPSGTLRTVTWVFSLAPAFPSGSFTLVATANDADPFPYLIGGGPLQPPQTPQPLSIDLLPWKSLSIPITVP